MPGCKDAERDAARDETLRPGVLEAPLGSILRMRLPGSGQIAEIHIRVALMNRFNALGTAEIVRVA